MAVLSRASLAAAAAAYLGRVARCSVDQCPGSIDIDGFGSAEMVAAQWNTPGVVAGPVQCEGGTVEPDMWGRAYFADSCTSGNYSNTQYVAMKLLGKRLTYTTDLSKSGCGCNTAMYLVSMRQNTEASGCSDYYCDANSVCGPNCAEIDIQEANRFAWHSTLHTAYDGNGVSGGYGGWVHNNNQYDFGAEEYGPDGRCVDTKKPFQVSTAFPIGAGGKLRAMEVTLSQADSPCSVSITLGSYGADAGFERLTKALEDGMTPVVSYWKSSGMLWLDGPGVGGGPCAVDDTPCDGAPHFAGFSVSDIEGRILL